MDGLTNSSTWLIQKADFTKDKFKDFVYSLSTANLKMISFIKEVKSQYGLRVIAVSNESQELNAYRITTFKLNEIFDFFVSSCYFHIRKPDAAISRLALDGAQVPADEIIYVDDVQMFVGVVKDRCVTSIHHTDYLSTFQTLTDLALTIKQENLDHE